MARRDGPLYDEEKEKATIEWENKVLFYLMPSVGLVAFIIGLVGFILAIQSPDAVGAAVFLIILAVLGLGGIAYGVVMFLKKQKNKRKVERKEPDEQ